MIFSVEVRFPIFYCHFDRRDDGGGTKWTNAIQTKYFKDVHHLITPIFNLLSRFF